MIQYVIEIKDWERENTGLRHLQRTKNPVVPLVGAPEATEGEIASRGCGRGRGPFVALLMTCCSRLLGTRSIGDGRLLDIPGDGNGTLFMETTWGGIQEIREEGEGAMFS